MMQMSGVDMRFHLKRISAIIEPSHLAKEQVHTLTRTMNVICCMDPNDMAAGYRKTSRTGKQATRNLAKLISSIILTILLEASPGFATADDWKISWNDQKQRQRWRTHGVRRGAQDIPRLDIFIHKLLIDDTISTHHWINSADNWEIYEHDRNDDDSHSNLEYDSSDLITTATNNTSNQEPQSDQNKKKNKRTLAAKLTRLLRIKKRNRPQKLPEDTKTNNPSEKKFYQTGQKGVE